jgi:hypothetical protein
MTDDLVESLHGDDFGGSLAPVDTSEPPRMVWTIVAVPEGSEAEAAPHLEAIGRIDGSFVETAR